MENNLWAKKITRNMVVIKDRLSLGYDIIVDFLIQQDAVPFSIKREMDGIPMLGCKIDHLIEILILNGPTACQEFVLALEEYGSRDIATRIRETKLPELEYIYDESEDKLKESSESRNAMDISLMASIENALVETKAKAEAEIQLMQQERKKLNLEKETFMKQLEEKSCEEMAKMKQRLSELVAQNKELMNLNTKLNSDLQSLWVEFSTFKCKSMQESSEKRREMEILKEKDETLKHRIETLEKENIELRKENKMLSGKLVDKKKLKKQEKNETLTNTENGKHILRRYKLMKY